MLIVKVFIRLCLMILKNIIQHPILILRILSRILLLGFGLEKGSLNLILLVSIIRSTSRIIRLRILLLILGLMGMSIIKIIKRIHCL